MCNLTTMEFHPKPTCLFQQSRPRKVERQLIWTPVSSRSNEDLIANILLQPYQAAKPLSINSRNTAPLCLGGTPTIFNIPDPLEVTTRNGLSSHSVDELWKPENFTNGLEATIGTSFCYETPTWQPTQSNPIPPLESEPTMSSWLNATCTDSNTPNLQLEHTLGLWPIQDWTESCLIAAGEVRALQTYADGQLNLSQDEGFGYGSMDQSSQSCMEQHSLPRQGSCLEDLSEIFVFGSTAQNDLQFEISPISTKDFPGLSPIEEHSSEQEPLVVQPSTDSELLEVPQLSNAGFSFLSMQESHIPQLSNPRELLSTAILDDTPIRSTEAQPTLADHLITFDLKPPSSPLKRKRSAFSLEGKKKVRSVRQNGACVSCRARKVSCSVKEVCEACLRLVDDPFLAGQICMRDRLKDTFIGFEDFHGSLSARKANLQPLLSSLIGPSQHIILSIFPGNSKKHGIAELPLNVMRCSFSPRCRWKRLREIHEIYITCEVVENDRYVIIPNSLPTVDELDDFGRKALSMSEGSHSGKMTSLLDDFLLLYCRNISCNCSKVQRLAHLTLRIASLNNLVAYGFLNLRDGSFDLLSHPPEEGASTRAQFVSETIHDQIRLIAAQGLQSVEKHVFSEIDNLNSLIGTNVHARIIVGICLLRLMLLYRDRLIRDEIRLELPRKKKLHQYRMEKAEVMYRRLTIAYSTLYNSSNTPLTTEWEDGLPSERNQMLHNLFLQLQPEFLNFCNERLTRNHDNVLERLVAGPPKDHRRTKRRKCSG